MKPQGEDISTWGVAIQIFRGGQWTPLSGREYWNRRNAHLAAAAHIGRANRKGLDPRNLAIFSFGRGKFEWVRMGWPGRF